MPSLAISLDGWPTSWWPSNVTEPVRFSTMPITDFKVVVLPAPLRPGSVTSSPWPTSKPTPWRMCDSPYQASRPSTFRSVSAMTGPDIGFDDRWLLRHGAVGPLGQHLATRQHGDGVGEIGHDRHVVLDHQHGPILGDGADQGRDTLDVLLPEAGHRLVEQHHRGLKRESGGDLERPLAAVRQLDGRQLGEGAEAHRLDEFEGAPIEPVEHLLGAPEIEGIAELALERDPHVLADRKMGE